MFTHEVLPNPETWADGSAQRYGWQHDQNVPGVYGMYGHIRLADKAIPTHETLGRIVAIRQAIEVLGADAVGIADIVTANALKPDGQICTDQEVWDMNLHVGVYMLKPAIELTTAA